MNVGQIRSLMKGLPKNMEVMLDTGDGFIVSVCAENSQVIELPLLDAEDEDFINDEAIGDYKEDEETIEILLLVPCSHTCHVEEGELNSLNRNLINESGKRE